MTAAADNNITELLVQWSEGKAGALDQLAPLVYEQLQRMASRYLRGERASHTMQTTSLVHEAFLKLVEQRDPRWQGRTHFFSLASQLMRRILVDHARAHLAVKRGEGREKTGLEGLESTLEAGGENMLAGRYDHAAEEGSRAELLSIDEALTRLAQLDQRQARIVELRFFGGLTVGETAQTLEVSDATVKRDWVMAKAWLARELASVAER